MAHETVDLRNRIVRDPAIQVGRAVVRGTGIPVPQILAMFAANPNVPPEEADPEDVRIVGRVIWVGRRV